MVLIISNKGRFKKENTINININWKIQTIEKEYIFLETQNEHISISTWSCLNESVFEHNINGYWAEKLLVPNNWSFTRTNFYFITSNDLTLFRKIWTCVFRLEYYSFTQTILFIPSAELFEIQCIALSLFPFKKRQGKVVMCSAISSHASQEKNSEK